MKNFSIQSFTLMMMMMMMMTVSSAAPQNHTGFPPESLLKQIHHEANKLMTNTSSELKNKSVKFPKRDSTTCWKEFFCLTEKSLESTSLDVMAKLTGLVEKYNKVANVTCIGVQTHPTPLHKLVEKIKFCSKMKLN